MFTNISPFLAALLIPSSLTFPYPFMNTTAPNNSTTPEYKCTYIYPSDLTVLNERYPDYNESHLHDASTLFMLRREVPEVGEIATRVQFQNLPSNISNTTCRLEFVLPQPELQTIQGFNPTFDTYQVNGEPEALERTRSVGGVAAINEAQCNETLTFQMGMAFNNINGVPNYWSFVQATPPAWPEQGFRMVWGC
jgi:hypothetical protein